MRTILITGAADFIGSNFVRMMREKRPDVRIVAFDALTYAGNLENLAGVSEVSGFQFVRGDICDAEALRPWFEGGLDAVVNFAAESRVDRSILGAQEFVRTNVVGVQILLDLARQFPVKRFLQVSTDEVYGSLGPTGKFMETTPIAPSSPYSASKAAADLLVHSYHHTFGLPTLITRCSNNYGPYQFSEKLIPLFVTNLLAGQKVPVYGDGMNVRDWIHVRDHCEAILVVLEKASLGSVYNIGGDCEVPNIEITRQLLRLLGRDGSFIQYVKDRPGHDRRYAMDISRIERDLGWRPRIAFEQGLSDTVEWYKRNEDWWTRIKTGDYLHYYDRQYGVGGVVEAAAAGSRS
ncbi:MAG: dTDP-glucose 4,6-dehydratase [Planctomycetes bacterium]|nr:dTDP-glucose 4,6-dehydratase [Planctomycetota bacterium]MBI3833256.1 dTDP-glucose 4,6-dehydratase [Planctomycetota bacterium]